MLQLKSSGIFKTTTFRTNRLKGCSFASDKELKKEGRGSYDYQTDVNSGLHVMKWYDNKCIHLALTFPEVNATGSVKQWDSKAKNHKDVPLPDMISDYNSSMGGVHLADMLITLYWTEITTKKRWSLKLIFYMVDICKVNDWLLYRRFCDQQQIPKKTQKPLLIFITELAHALRLSGKLTSVGSRRKESLSPQPAVVKKPAVTKPVSGVRYDVVDRFPEFGDKNGKCQYSPDGYNSVYWKNIPWYCVYERIKIVFLNFVIKFFDEYKNVLYIIFFCLFCLFPPPTANLEISAMNTQNRISSVLYHSKIIFTTVCIQEFN